MAKKEHWNEVAKYPYHNNRLNGIRKFTKIIKTYEENYEKLDFSGLGRILNNNDECMFFKKYCFAEEEDRKAGLRKIENELSLYRGEWYRRNYP